MEYQVSAKITSKGQLTLPQAIRRLLGVREGDRVVFEVNEAGEVRIKPQRSESPFARYQGIGFGMERFKSREEIDAYLRKLRGREG
jgi:antitoxin PrlF